MIVIMSYYPDGKKPPILAFYPDDEDQADDTAAHVANQMKKR